MSELTLHPRQLDLAELIGKHKSILAYGSSRGGKSFFFIYALVMRALMFPGSNHCVIRSTAASIPSTIWPTALEVLRAIAPGFRETVEDNKSERRITLENGSTIWFLGAQNEEAVQKIMGAQFATIFLNEVVLFDFDAYQDIASRLNASDTLPNGSRIQLKLFADCNPTDFTSWVYQQWLKKVVPGTVRPLEDAWEFGWLKFDADANPDVDPSYYKSMRNWSAEKRARFLEGEWRESAEGALFSQEDLDDNREKLPDLNEFDQTVVAIDPAMTVSENSDETGIVVAGSVGEDTDAQFYPIEDLSGKYHIHEWAKKAIEAYWKYGCKAIVIETNQGGAYNDYTLKSIDPRVNVVLVNPGKGQGKNERAKPIASLMKAGRIHHPFENENFKKLEAQLLAMTGDYDRRKGKKSPDRLDAYVYAVGELLTGDGPVKPIVRSKAGNFF